MRLKDNSVIIQGIRPELLFAMQVVDGVYDTHGQELVITSVVDGGHDFTSLHYSGGAFDARTFYFTVKVLHSVHREIKKRLGVDFDVVLESNHMHIEYQPKRRS
ncbi:MAG TPA: hypothetical protein VFC92_06595 [Bacteroidales bacterium]|nr:hypothetical protein [Bacteroidales bacterium]